MYIVRYIEIKIGKTQVILITIILLKSRAITLTTFYQVSLYIYYDFLESHKILLEIRVYSPSCYI